MLAAVMVSVTEPAGAARGRNLTGYATSYIANESQEPVITSVSIAFKGQPVSYIIAATKAKRYTVSVFGIGFDSSSTIVVSGQALQTELTGPNELTARLKGIVLTPGVLSLRVVDAGGQSSNAKTLDVVTDPARLAVEAISRTNGPVGTEVTLTGHGFTATGNQITFARASGSPAHGVVPMPANSTDGSHLTFTVPPALWPCLACAGAPFGTDAAQFRLFVTNATGTSNSIGFLVSSATGPIGVWGAATNSQGFLGLKVTVTDTEVDIEGGCFAGFIAATLTTDEAGNFSARGFYSVEAGPVGGVAHLTEAKFAGSIQSNMMVLTIRVTGQASPIGPFALNFSNDVVVLHPCV